LINTGIYDFSWEVHPEHPETNAVTPKTGEHHKLLANLQSATLLKRDAERDSTITACSSPLYPLPRPNSRMVMLFRESRHGGVHPL